MIQRSDLRVGNYLQFKDASLDTVQVIEAKQNVLVLKILDINMDVIMELPYEYIGPIDITKEWLVQLGFLKPHTTWYHIEIEHGYLDYNLQLQQLFASSYGGFESVRLANIHYIHELQNLYYYLVRKELFLKANENPEKKAQKIHYPPCFPNDRIG